VPEARTWIWRSVRGLVPSRNSGVPPQRVQPPVSSQGVNETVLLAAEDMKGVIGIYDSALGAQSNEVSGRAIMARDRQGDIGSFVYQDNWGRAIRHTATIVNDLIPHVYDVERTIRWNTSHCARRIIHLREGRRRRNNGAGCCRRTDPKRTSALQPCLGDCSLITLAHFFVASE